MPRKPKRNLKAAAEQANKALAKGEPIGSLSGWLIDLVALLCYTSNGNNLANRKFKGDNGNIKLIGSVKT